MPSGLDRTNARGVITRVCRPDLWNRLSKGISSARERIKPLLRAAVRSRNKSTSRAYSLK
jgi:hypothetical protein